MKEITDPKCPHCGGRITVKETRVTTGTISSLRRSGKASYDTWGDTTKTSVEFRCVNSYCDRFWPNPERLAAAISPLPHIKPGQVWIKDSTTPPQIAMLATAEAGRFFSWSLITSRGEIIANSLREDSMQNKLADEGWELTHMSIILG